MEDTFDHDYSGSSSSSSDDSGKEDNPKNKEEEMKVKAEAEEEAAKRRRKRIRIQEVIYKSNERVTISDDVYNLTIAANMTKNVRPASLVFAIRYCVLVFTVQLAIAYYFCFEVRFFD